MLRSLSLDLADQERSRILKLFEGYAKERIDGKKLTPGTIETNIESIINSITKQSERNYENLKEAIEQNEMLESQMTGNENNARDTSLDNDDKYQELNIRCIELEEQLRDSNEINEKKKLPFVSTKSI